jgi:hypothetical protein
MHFPPVTPPEVDQTVPADDEFEIRVGRIAGTVAAMRWPARPEVP